MISILRPLYIPTSYRQILCFSGSCRIKKVINAFQSHSNNGPEGVRALCVCIYTPFWRVWRKAGSRSSDSCSKNPNEDTRPSPGCTSHRRSSSAQSPQNCRGHMKRWVRSVILPKTCLLYRCRLYGDAYGPHSTRSERTLSMPISQTFMHSALISIMRPWKFSWSNTCIWWRERNLLV